MAQLIIDVSDDRFARIQNLLRFRGQTLEQFLEPWLADADTHMGHAPMDSIEDQQAAAARFARKADAAEAKREEATRKQQETAILAETDSGKEKEGKDV